MSELLAPNLLNLEEVFNKEFSGMVDKEVSYQSLLHYRDELIAEIRRALIDEERRFLLSVKLGKPDWSLMSGLEIQTLPALKWKVMNVRKMAVKKHQEQVDKLKRALEL